MARVDDQMKKEILRLEDSLDRKSEAIILRIFVHSLAKKLVLEKMRTLPRLLSYNGLSLVIHIVGGSLHDLTVFSFVCPKHRVDAEVKVVNKIILIGPKGKLRLPNLSLLEVYNEVTVYYSATVFFAFGFIGQANKDIAFVIELPGIQNNGFHLGDMLLDRNGSIELVRLVESSFSLNNLISFNFKGVIVSGLVPTHR